MEFLELDGGVVGTAAAAAAGGEGGGKEEREVSLMVSLGWGWTLGLLTALQCGEYEWEED